ncbi:MAG: LLM class flavin-dependent oxidoreductase [Gammaproteobacteria bacterium]|nr:LLM class flavin-dependent oxidoreductase [Gammaproteobacteria bacterium]
MDLTLFISPEHRQDSDFGRCFEEHMEQVRLARAVGFDGVAIGNHLSYSSAAWFPPMESLMRLSTVAQGMSLATCTLVLPMYHPLHVAQQAALLDIVSGGRFTLGVAQGWQAEEFRVLGIDFKERLGRFRESVTLLQRLWTEASVDFDGRYYQADGLSLVLKPMRRPRPPMWFGGSVSKAVARAAALADPTLGDSWVASSHLTEAVITEQAGVFRDNLARLGKPMPAEFPLLRNIVVAPDRETALREAGPFIADSYRVFGNWGLFTEVVGAGKQQLDFDELLAGRVIIGSPEECAEALVRLARATGFTRLITRIQWHGMDQRVTLRTIELLATRVKPLVEAALV